MSPLLNVAYVQRVAPYVPNVCTRNTFCIYARAHYLLMNAFNMLLLLVHMSSSRSTICTHMTGEANDCIERAGMNFL